MAKQQEQKRKSIVINNEQFTQLLNYLLFESGLFVSTNLVQEPKTETAPAAHSLTLILGTAPVNTKSQLLGILNTYCDKTELLSKDNLGVVAQCDVLVGPESTVQELTQEQAEQQEQDKPETEG